MNVTGVITKRTGGMLGEVTKLPVGCPRAATREPCPWRVTASMSGQKVQIQQTYTRRAESRVIRQAGLRGPYLLPPKHGAGAVCDPRRVDAGLMPHGPRLPLKAGSALPLQPVGLWCGSPPMAFCRLSESRGPWRMCSLEHGGLIGRKLIQALLSSLP